MQEKLALSHVADSFRGNGNAGTVVSATYVAD